MYTGRGKFMKKYIVLLIFIMFSFSFLSPAFAKRHTNEEVIQKMQTKYQKKIEKNKSKKSSANIALSKNKNSYFLNDENLSNNIQKSIKQGLSQAEAALVLGAPNIVTTDYDGKETWVYDNIQYIVEYDDFGFIINQDAFNCRYKKNKACVNKYGKGISSPKYIPQKMTIGIKFKNEKVDSFKYKIGN